MVHDMQLTSDYIYLVENY